MSAVKEKKTKYKGIRLRNNMIWIDFRYKGKRCREPFGMEGSEKNIESAYLSRNSIVWEIKIKTFDYAKHFPNSNKIEVFGGKKNTSITIAEAIDTWFKRFEKKGEKNIKTYLKYQNDINKHIKPFLGTILLSELTTEQLDKWISKLTCSNKTILNILIPLKWMLFDAIKYKQISSNPILHIDKLVVKKIKPNPLMINEIDDLLSTLSGCEKNFYEVAIWTGLSTGEQITLYWEDIDFENRTLMIQRAYDKFSDNKIGKTKNEFRTRPVELLEPAWQALRKQQKLTGHEKLVFINPRTNSFWSYDSLSVVWHKALTKINATKRVPYQTRHTFASIMISAGLPLAWLQQQMGHSSLEMIDKKYAKWLKGADKVRAWIKKKTQNGHNGNDFNAFFFK